MKMLKIGIGLGILFTVVLGYATGIAPLFELTCISNTLGGLILIIDGLLNYQKRNVPSQIYSCVITCTTTVWLTVCFEVSGYHFFNFQGAFLFLHGINPAILLIMYLLTFRTAQLNQKMIWYAPIIVMVYGLFDVMRFAITGKLVYGLVPTDILSIGTVLFIGIALYFFEVFISWVIAKLQQCAHALTTTPK